MVFRLIPGVFHGKARGISNGSQSTGQKLEIALVFSFWFSSYKIGRVLLSFRCLTRQSDLKQSNVKREISLCLLKGEKNINVRWYYTVFQSEGGGGGGDSRNHCDSWLIDVSVHETTGKYRDKAFRKTNAPGWLTEQEEVFIDLGTCSVLLDKMCEFSRVEKFNILIL